MEKFFNAKVYVVTGGASGIGLAVTTLLLEYGAYVCAVDLHATISKGLETLPRERLTYVQGNVKDRKQSHEIITSITKKHNRLDGLVNCAGICPLEGEMPSDEIYDDVFDTNVRGTWNFSTEALAWMKAQGSGSIVNLGSVSSNKGVGRLPCYTAGKHALAGFTRTWALDFAKYGIRVNMVSPGIWLVLDLFIIDLEDSDNVEVPLIRAWYESR